jgi:hypothetical protein
MEKQHESIDARRMNSKFIALAATRRTPLNPSYMIVACEIE